MSRERERQFGWKYENRWRRCCILIYVSCMMSFSLTVKSKIASPAIWGIKRTQRKSLNMRYVGMKYPRNPTHILGWIQRREIVFVSSLISFETSSMLLWNWVWRSCHSLWVSQNAYNLLYFLSCSSWMNPPQRLCHILTPFSAQVWKLWRGVLRFFCFLTKHHNMKAYWGVEV